MRPFWVRAESSAVRVYYAILRSTPGMKKQATLFPNGRRACPMRKKVSRAQNKSPHRVTLIAVSACTLFFFTVGMGTNNIVASCNLFFASHVVYPKQVHTVTATEKKSHDSQHTPAQGCIGRGRGTAPPPPPGPPAYVQPPSPWRQVPASIAFAPTVTAPNRFGNLRQPPL